MISVIVPTYNYANYIGKAVDSVLCQSYSDLEIIIVDDGSTDNTKDIVSKFNDSRIHYFYQKNQGANVARNRGVAEANGEYILFLDSDDVLHPQHLEAYLQVALKNPGSNIYGPWEKGYFEGERFVVDFAKGKCPGDDLLEHWLGNWWVASNCILWARKNLQLVGEWDETLHANQDGDMALRALIAGVQFVYAENAPVARITMHGNENKSISDTKTRKTYESRVKVLEKSEKMLKENNNLKREYCRSLAMRYYYFAKQTLYDYPNFSDRCFRKYLKLNGLRKPDETYLSWVFIIFFGLRGKARISNFFSRLIPWRA